MTGGRQRVGRAGVVLTRDQRGSLRACAGWNVQQRATSSSESGRAGPGSSGFTAASSQRSCTPTTSLNTRTDGRASSCGTSWRSQQRPATSATTHRQTSSRATALTRSRPQAVSDRRPPSSDSSRSRSSASGRNPSRQIERLARISSREPRGWSASPSSQKRAAASRRSGQRGRRSLPPARRPGVQRTISALGEASRLTQPSEPTSREDDLTRGCRTCDRCSNPRRIADTASCTGSWVGRLDTADRGTGRRE